MKAVPSGPVSLLGVRAVDLEPDAFQRLVAFVELAALVPVQEDPGRHGGLTGHAAARGTQLVALRGSSPNPDDMDSRVRKEPSSLASRSRPRLKLSKRRLMPAPTTLRFSSLQALVAQSCAEADG